MIGIFANTFRTATGRHNPARWDAPAHWTGGERFDNRGNAELEAHLTGRRRD